MISCSWVFPIRLEAVRVETVSSIITFPVCFCATEQ